MQEVVGGVMFREVADHAAYEAQTVNTPPDVWEQFADGRAALAELLELPGAGHHRADVVKLRGLDFRSEGFAMLALQPRFRIKAVDLRYSAVHVQEDDAPRASAKAWRDGRAGRGIVRTESREGDKAKTIRAPGEHIAPRYRRRYEAPAMHVAFS
jgi:hypothetical protein